MTTTVVFSPPTYYFKKAHPYCGKRRGVNFEKVARVSAELELRIEWIDRKELLPNPLNYIPPKKRKPKHTIKL